MQSILDVVLDRFETKYAEFLAILDELLAKPAPSKLDLKRLRGHLPHSPTAQSYFFDRLDSAEWLRPLEKAGFFKAPPGPEDDPEGRGISLPGWPQSRYLARMAAKRPNVVTQIILDAPSTTNGRVIADFLDAAKAMPAHLAAPIASKVVARLDSTFGVFLLTERIADLILCLAENGHAVTALELARALLALPRPVESTGPVLPPEPTARIERWFYGKTLAKLSRVLTDAAGDRWFETLCELLTEAVRYSVREGEHDNAPEDHSTWWRPAIDNHTQNKPTHSIVDQLVEAVRDAAEALVASDPSKLRATVAGLERRSWKIFWRIALHLLRLHPDAGRALIAERLANRAYFDDRTLHHEYYLLAEECFGKLDPDAQAMILGWIQQGPPVERVTASFERLYGRPPSAEEIEQDCDAWRFRRLFPLRQGLSGNWVERYQDLAGRFPEPEHPEFLSYGSGGVWSGIPSPKSLEELQSLDLPDLIDFLGTWRPSGKSLEASPEGLGRDLTAVVAEAPVRFAHAAEQFQGLEPTYVRAMVEGLTQAIEKKRVFEWSAVLSLCEWVVAQPRDALERSVVVREADPNWGWTRKAIARLLEKGLAKGEAEIPIDLRAQVWRLLQALAEDPEPTAEYEVEYGGSNMDPATMSINTVRGVAMHAAIEYGLWVRRHLEKQPDANGRLERGFGEMPELRELLERHLDVNSEPALAIRAIYGQYFPWLALLDEAWARDNTGRIFPTDEANEPPWNAAWNTYVTFCRPYDNAVLLLGDQYQHAVELIGAGSGRRVAFAEDPERELAGHLMTLYWRGGLGLDSLLLAGFYQKAAGDLRAYALEFVGRSLGNTEGTVEPDVLDRLQKLWEHRIGAAQNPADHSAFDVELAAFAWWFRSGKFENRWALEQLRRSFVLAPTASRESFLVVEPLGEMVSTMPLEAVECVSLLIEADREHFIVVGHREELRNLLRTALGSGKLSASQAARELVNRLVARGHVEFRDLLSEG